MKVINIDKYSVSFKIKIGINTKMANQTIIIIYNDQKVQSERLMSFYAILVAARSGLFAWYE